MPAGGTFEAAAGLLQSAQLEFGPAITTGYGRGQGDLGKCGPAGRAAAIIKLATFRQTVRAESLPAVMANTEGLAGGVVNAVVGSVHISISALRPESPKVKLRIGPRCTTDLMP